MRRIIIALLLSFAISVIGLYLALDYWKSSGIGNQSGTDGRANRATQPNKTTHPRLEAHRLLEQKTTAAVVYEWIPYYYRHPRPHETVEVMEVLLSQGNVDPIRVGAHNHFFAAILHENKEELEKLKAASQRYAGKQLETLVAVIEEAENYEAVYDISPSSLEAIWAEYMVTGEKEIITRMIHALEPSGSYDEPRFVEAIQNSFYSHLPAYWDAYNAFDEVCQNATGVFRDRLEQIKNTIKESFADPANVHLRRADNYIKQRQYGPALDEFEKSLSLYPDYLNVFVNVANMYEEQRRLPEAVAAMKKAVQINPTDPVACYGMGRHCFMQGKHDEAINWYTEALRYHPKAPKLVHAIARSYQNKGDTANAVKYFQLYLQYAPNGEHVDLVRGYLASVNAPAEESSSVFAAFKRKDFEALERQLAAILEEKKKNKAGHSLLANAYDQLCYNPDAKYSMEKWLGHFEDWLNRNPSSHFANAAIGMFYIAYAWHARGEGWGSTLTEKGGRLYQERLLKAREYLEKAYRSDPSDPMVPSQLINIANGLGANRAEMEIQFQRAIQADRSEFRAYQAKLTYLMPKWHGSRELMFAFARDTARNAPPDSLVPLVLANAHWEMCYRSGDEKSYFKQREVWDEVKSVYATACRQFPESKEHHNWFARAAYLAGDLETARQELAIIQDDWSEIVWDNYVRFTKVQEEIFRK